jgi:hypothetical protein
MSYNNPTKITQGGITLSIRIYSTPTVIEIQEVGSHEILLEHRYSTIPTKEELKHIINYAFTKIDKLYKCRISLGILKQELEN